MRIEVAQCCAGGCALVAVILMLIAAVTLNLAPMFGAVLGAASSAGFTIYYRRKELNYKEESVDMSDTRCKYCDQPIQFDGKIWVLTARPVSLLISPVRPWRGLFESPPTPLFLGNGVVIKLKMCSGLV